LGRISRADSIFAEEGGSLNLPGRKLAITQARFFRIRGWNAEASLERIMSIPHQLLHLYEKRQDEPFRPAFSKFN
jgi:hypothetical protein